MLVCMSRANVTPGSIVSYRGPALLSPPGPMAVAHSRPVILKALPPKELIYDWNGRL